MENFDLFSEDMSSNRKADLNEVFDLAILGAGPAGLTASIYAGRAGLKFILVERLSSGGQIVFSDQVDNYPGFPEGISGSQLMERFEKQASKFGTQIFSGEVREIKKSDNLFLIETSSGTIKARSVIYAMGADPMKLPVPEEGRFRGKGVSYCATCDAAFFKDKIVCVVGGGDTALYDALHLSRFAKNVIVLHRRDKLRAVKVLQDIVKKNPRIELLLEHIPLHIIGNKKVEGLEVENVKTRESKVINIDGIFVAIGIVPNTLPLKGIVELDEKGFIRTDLNMETSVQGLFAAGDVRATPLRQVVTAASDGAIAAFSAQKYLENLER